MATICSSERSFSQVCRIKDVKRSTMSQQRLGVLALLCIEKDLLSEMDFSFLIDELSTVKARKVIILMTMHILYVALKHIDLKSGTRYFCMSIVDENIMNLKLYFETKTKH